MLNTPARNATATARPVRISGVARTSVPEPNAYHEPNAPESRARSASPITSRYPNRSAREQPANHRDAEHGTESEHRKEPFPSDDTDNRIDQQRAYRREEKSGGGLNRQRGSNGVRWHGLCDERAELRRIGDHEESPA